ncbi:hypothetical protein CF65_01762 [Aggregatibacter actinomycetemcomitans HK1651]|nr:hypothetical protein CF65_01762 [Aggregatibacter actinomycetemcomitans HK1651]
MVKLHIFKFSRFFSNFDFSFYPLNKKGLKFLSTLDFLYFSTI